MKRLYTFFVCICLVLVLIQCVLTVQAAAEDRSEFEYSVVDGSVAVTKYISSGENAIIPQSIDGIPVTAIAADAFKGNQTLKSVSVPDSVLYIGDRAVHSCSSLEEVKLGRGVREIGSYAGIAGALYELKKDNII